MRSPLRWKLRTMMLVVAVAGLGFAGVALRRRAERYRGLALEFSVWESRLPQALALFDDSIEMYRRQVDLDQHALRIAPEQLGPNWGAGNAVNMKRRIEVREKFVALQEDCRRRQRMYAHAARQPWITVPAGESVDLIFAALGDEFFADVPAAPDFAKPTAVSPSPSAR